MFWGVLFSGLMLLAGAHLSSISHPRTCGDEDEDEDGMEFRDFNYLTFSAFNSFSRKSTKRLIGDRIPAVPGFLPWALPFHLRWFPRAQNKIAVVALDTAYSKGGSMRKRIVRLTVLLGILISAGSQQLLAEGRFQCRRGIRPCIR